MGVATASSWSNLILRRFNSSTSYSGSTGSGWLLLGRLQLCLEPFLLALSAALCHELPHVVIGFDGLSGLIADAHALVRIKLPHSLADVAADRIHQIAIHSVFEHARNGMVAQIVRPQLAEAGDLTQMIP